MKVTRLGRTRPSVGIGAITGGAGGAAGTGLVSTGSNGGTEWRQVVYGITANGSNLLLGPFVNLAAGSNTILTIDQGPGGSMPSNTVRIHSTGGGSGGSGDMTKAVYDIDNDGKVDNAEKLTTAYVEVLDGSEANTVRVRNLTNNTGTYLLVTPKGQPASGDTSIHLYYSRTSEGAAHELFLGMGANHGANQYLFASGDSNDSAEPLPILFLMERGVVHHPVIKMDSDSTVLFYKQLRLTEMAAPSTPASGEAVIYVKTDGKVYLKNDAGTEYDLTSGSAALDDLTDVTITSVATGDMLRYNGSAWVNTPGRWEVVVSGSGPPVAVSTPSDDDWVYAWVSS